MTFAYIFIGVVSLFFGIIFLIKFWSTKKRMFGCFFIIFALLIPFLMLYKIFSEENVSEYLKTNLTIAVGAILLRPRKKVICGGCFNRVHKGHIYFLKQAKKLGLLVVVVSNDKLNMKKYGKNATPARIRKKNIETLGIADKVVIGDDIDFTKVIKKEKPDIVALGYDQKLPVKTKIKVRRIKKFGNYSSRKTNLLKSL